MIIRISLLLLKIGGYRVEILQFFQGIQNSFFDALFEGASMLGETNFYIVAMAAMLWCINKKYGYQMGLAIISSGILNLGIKETFHTSRPIGVEGLRSLRTKTAPGYSFPSGHTQGAATFCTSIMVKLKKKWIYFLGSIIIVFVGISRLYLAVHWPVDVIFGLIFGVCWVFVSNLIFEMADNKGKYYLFLFLIIPAVIGLFFVKKERYYQMVGVLISLIIGYIIENKYIKYEVRCCLWKQIIKLVSGIAIILVIKISFKAILPVSLISDFVRYFIMGMWMIVGAPLMFNLFKLKYIKGKSK